MPRKTYRKSDKCELVYTPISWNILDEEQLKDFTFIDDAVNVSGKIKECVRLVRLSNERTESSIFIPDGTTDANHPDYLRLEESDLDDSLDQLVDTD